MSKLLYGFLLSLTGLYFCSCGSDNGPVNSCGADYDQVALFSNYVEQLIIPNYENFHEDLQALSLAMDDLSAMGNQENLLLVQEKFRTAYKSWQWVAGFQFGPADEQELRSSCNNFPANRDQIEFILAGGDFDPGLSEQYERGFPALDYLLFKNDAEWVLSELEGNSQFSIYMFGIIELMLSRSEATLQAWRGEYGDNFLTNTGSAAGSSLSLLINNLSKQYERIKSEKIGLPSGELTLQFTYPERVEAVHSGLSLALLQESLKASKYQFEGRSRLGSQGMGLAEYLEYVNAKKGDQALKTVILDQYDLALQEVASLAEPLSETIENNTSSVVDTYNEISQQVIHLKTDMPSVLCVSITYVDNPSDSD